MQSRLLLVTTAALVAAALSGGGPAGAGVPRDDLPAKAQAVPKSPGSRQVVRLRFRARYDSYRATYVANTTGPRHGCGTASDWTADYDSVDPGDRLDFELTPPRGGWCRGVHRVRLVATAWVDMSDDDCEQVPETASSACPEELNRVTLVDRRTSFRVR
ncbi:hypothetical protein DSM112329_00528 [Paraconexibacter sp. AEG42_29]|uniref:Secreted protein n=1 Tax=Paraconexibacter sp. AEG42_29 TaxID=2997339 RepID=A0AAU7APV2_9ACTN